MKNQLNRLLTLLFAAALLIAMIGCDDPESVILDQILENVPSYQSPYTGGLQRIGTVKNFGLNLDSPVAIEWNGQHLYMLADSRNGQYLFTVDRNTGIATFVNRGAMNLGGDFSQGRSFTQVLYVEPTDMTWIPFPDHYVKGVDYFDGYTGNMVASCPILDSIVFINIDTGTAGRLSRLRDFCLTTENGSPQYAGPRGLAFDGEELFTGALLLDSPKNNAELLRVTGNYRCASPLNENPLNFGVGEAAPYALCFDQQYLYMSGSDTRALYIIDRHIGTAHFVADWYFVEMPEGFRTHELGDILNIKENMRGNIWITGLAHDGTDMFAIEAFTSGLYKLERQ